MLISRSNLIFEQPTRNERNFSSITPEILREHQRARVEDSLNIGKQGQIGAEDNVSFGEQFVQKDHEGQEQRAHQKIQTCRPGENLAELFVTLHQHLI